MLVNHPEDWKEISEQIEEEERRKKRKRKLIIIPSVLAGAVLTILFFTLWLPAIKASIANNAKPDFGLVMETTAGERVESNGTYIWAWSGIVENKGGSGGYCRITLKIHGKNQYFAEYDRSFNYETGFVISGGRAGYSFLINDDLNGLTSYSLDITNK